MLCCSCCDFSRFIFSMMLFSSEILSGPLGCAAGADPWRTPKSCSKMSLRLCGFGSSLGGGGCEGAGVEEGASNPPSRSTSAFDGGALRCGTLDPGRGRLIGLSGIDSLTSSFSSLHCRSNLPARCPHSTRSYLWMVFCTSSLSRRQKFIMSSFLTFPMRSMSLFSIVLIEPTTSLRASS